MIDLCLDQHDQRYCQYTLLKIRDHHKITNIILKVELMLIHNITICTENVFLNQEQIRALLYNIRLDDNQSPYF